MVFVDCILETVASANVITRNSLSLDRYHNLLLTRKMNEILWLMINPFLFQP